MMSNWCTQPPLWSIRSLLHLDNFITCVSFTMIQPEHIRRIRSGFALCLNVALFEATDSLFCQGALWISYEGEIWQKDQRSERSCWIFPYGRCRQHNFRWPTKARIRTRGGRRARSKAYWAPLPAEWGSPRTASSSWWCLSKSAKARSTSWGMALTASMFKSSSLLQMNR